MAAVTITGENAYARSSELKKLVGAFKESEGDLALERLDGEEADFARISEALTSLPFLASRKMVVLNSPSKNKDFVDKAETLLANLPDTTDFVLYEPKFDKRSGLYKLLKKQTDFKEFGAPDVPALAKWVAEQAKANGAQISTGEARFLVERVGANQQLLAGEVEKLSLLGGTIDRARILELTEATPQSTIFQLLDAAMTGRADQALALYEQQRTMKVEPQQILAMFTWQLYAVALVATGAPRSSEQIAKEAKMSPYVVGKTQTLARRISGGRLAQIIDDLLQIDLRGKREALDLDDALKLFIIKLAE
jgi:DNA polymerase III delta subunit